MGCVFQLAAGAQLDSANERLSHRRKTGQQCPDAVRLSLWLADPFLFGRHIAGYQLHNIGGILNMLMLLTFTPFVLRTVNNQDILLIHSIADGLADALGHSLDARRSYILR